MSSQTTYKKQQEEKQAQLIDVGRSRYLLTTPEALFLPAADFDSRLTEYLRERYWE